MLTTAAFWKASAERAAKTFLQVYFATFLVGGVAGASTLNVFEFAWLGPTLGIALGAALLSFVTSLLSLGVGNPGPSLANEVALSRDSDAIGGATRTG